MLNCGLRNIFPSQDSNDDGDAKSNKYKLVRWHNIITVVIGLGSRASRLLAFDLAKSLSIRVLFLIW